MSELLSVQGLQTDLMMTAKSKRLESFSDWPFQSDCKCTPSAMSEAGFYHCPTAVDPDLVRCFACGHELDSWEPSDSPWEEHARHSQGCPWVELKPQETMGAKRMMIQMKEVSSFILRRWSNNLLKRFRSHREAKRENYKEQVTAAIMNSKK